MKLQQSRAEQSSAAQPALASRIAKLFNCNLFFLSSSSSFFYSVVFPGKLPARFIISNQYPPVPSFPHSSHVLHLCWILNDAWSINRPGFAFSAKLHTRFGLKTFHKRFEMQKSRNEFPFLQYMQKYSHVFNAFNVKLQTLKCDCLQYVNWKK